jgi:hypothetical protein
MMQQTQMLNANEHKLSADNAGIVVQLSLARFLSSKLRFHFWFFDGPDS